MKLEILKFPQEFYWGTATSAYQVEGGIKNDWSEAGNKYNAGIACDHYNRYEEDFDLAKAMGNNAHRFSIEWARIEPEEGKFSQAEIEHYRNVILALKERNLEPFVTLYHWTLPIWFAENGGWLNKDAPKYFERFTEKMIGEYKDLVKFWVTLNEPNVYTFFSCFMGIWPPFKRSWFKAKQVFKQLTESHIRAYQVIHKISPDAKVGIAYQRGESMVVSYEWIYKFLDSIKNYQDFIGLNYYVGSLGSSLWKKLIRAKKLMTDIGWEINPKGLYFVLKDLKRYNKPIYITENGLADKKDDKRAKFIIDHLKWVHKAIKEGIDVRGYFHWSLMDNFEWDKGFEPRFGLVEIDYRAERDISHAERGYKTLERKPRPSSKIYAEICKNNAINI